MALSDTLVIPDAVQDSEVDPTDAMRRLLAQRAPRIVIRYVPADQQLPPNYNSGCPDVLIGLKGLSSDPSLCGGLPPMGLPGRNQRCRKANRDPSGATSRWFNLCLAPAASPSVR